MGQKRISKEKRERGKGVIKELKADGFSLHDIDFAAKWTLENAKEELYDFSILKHTIGQATAAREKGEKQKAEKREAERRETEERQQEAETEREAERIRVLKESLGAEERKKLREQAEREVRESGKFKQEFITDILIEARENQILRSRLAADDTENETDPEKDV